MPKSSTQIYVSWRHLATDPDDIAYNVYYKTSETGTLTKLNSAPIANSTNYTATLSTASSAYTFVVKSVWNGVEKDEQGSFTVPRNTAISRIVRDINYRSLPSPEYDGITMNMKFCWPADLDGDGKYDYVIDRQNYGAAVEDEGGSDATDYPSPFVEAYSSEGQFLWRIKIGTNNKICDGANDGVTAYDMDGDGKAEVMIAVSEGATFPNGQQIKNVDGTVHNYASSAGSAPIWVAIVNGQTGNLIDTVRLAHFDEMQNTRTDKWKTIGGRFVVSYLDGIHPSLLYEYKSRLASGAFIGAFDTWRLIGGQLVKQWSHRFYKEDTQYDGHQVRVGDVDGDGKDEFLEISFTIDDDGSLLYHIPGINHGDRQCLADIDPDRPGLEHFFIQQSNMLGMGLNDARTGEIIAAQYLSALSDVGRGACGAFDTNRRGMQYWSTMSSYQLYDSKGNIIDNVKGVFPCEVLWWGAGLSRWHVGSADGDGKNLILQKFNGSGFDRDMPNLYAEGGNYYLTGMYGKRAAFWGDILGDWREELILPRRDASGFAVLTTWEETNIRQYCLMQNPAYRGQTTAKGYYQTADVDFYMAADMPKPPVAPVQKADLYYTGTGWVDYTNVAGTYADGKSIMFDIRATNTNYTVSGNLSPSRLWLMNPKGKHYTFGGSGKFTGEMDVIKSMQGDVVFNGSHDYTGITRISEGRLFVNGTLASPVQVDARGVIGGSATLNGGVTLETGLNVEGGRIEPGNGTDLGTMTIIGNLSLPGRNNLAFDIDQTKTTKSDLLYVQGDFTLAGNSHSIIIHPVSELEPGILTLITFTGTTNATAADFKITGLEGIPYTLLIEANAIKLELNEARAAGSVVWSGAHSNVWDFQTRNFLNGSTEDIFVPNDAVTFNDNAVNKSVTIDETMPVSGITFHNDTDYTVSGNGIISGDGGLTKTGDGKLSLKTTGNTFTGAVTIDGGVLEVSALQNGGTPSSIGASSAEATNWIMRNATLQTTAQMATNRNLQVEGKLTVNNPLTTNSVLISGNITGSGTALELTGKGTLTLQGNNSFGNVSVKDGLLLLGSADANRYSMGSAKITLSGGTFRMHDINTTGNTGTFSNAVEVPEGATAKWDLPSRWGISSKLTGSGTVTVNVPYVRSDLNGDWSEFAGTVNFTGRDIRLNNASARNLGNALVNLGSGTYLCVASNGSGEASAGQTITLGALAGSGGISGRNSLVIGAKNTNTTYSGVISSGSGKLTKKGDGYLTLSGNNLYTGGMDISEGTLIVAGTEGSATGTGNVSVLQNAALGGTGTIAGSVTVASTAAVEPGNELSSSWSGKLGTLTVEKNLTLNGTLKMGVRNATGYQSDKLVVKGSASIAGSLQVEIVNGATVVPLGAEVTLLDVTGTISGAFTSLDLPPTDAGTVWDTGALLTTGKIKVVAQTGLNNLSINHTFTIYPNPAKDCITVDVPPAEQWQIDIMDLSGKLVLSQAGLPAGEKIDVSALSPGFYLVKIQSKEGVKVLRLIKE
jgi:autotransporter-associated beta strand protein